MKYLRQRHQKHGTAKHREIVFESEQRDGRVGRALVVRLTRTGEIAWMEFYDIETGVTYWTAGKGLGQATLWQRAAAALDELGLDRPDDGTPVGSERREGYRPPHVEELEDAQWRRWIQQALRHPETPPKIPFSDDANDVEAPPAAKGLSVWGHLVLRWLRQ